MSKEDYKERLDPAQQMDLIRIDKKHIRISNEFYDGVQLNSGRTYLLQRPHAHALERRGFGKRVKGISSLSHFTEDCLVWHPWGGKVLFWFNGGLGDAVSLAFLLEALKIQYNIESDIACKYPVYSELLVPLGFMGKWLRPPVDVADLQNYNYVQTSADKLFSDKFEKWNACILEELGDAYKVNILDVALQYRISQRTIAACSIPPSKRINLGINFDSKGKIRSYPRSLQGVLVQQLTQAGFRVFLFGLEPPDVTAVSCDYVHDFCGKTTIPEVAALLKQMEIMVTVDSFMAHLANVLGVATLVMMSTTRAGIYKAHKNVGCLESRINCSPCGEIANNCPLGYSECQAFYHGSMAPELIARSIIEYCAHLFSSAIESCIG